MLSLFNLALLILIKLTYFDFYILSDIYSDKDNFNQNIAEAMMK